MNQRIILSAKAMYVNFVLVLSVSVASPAFAQPLADGAGKFVGNITTGGQVRADFGDYWNQITGENEHKWGSVERVRDQMSWGGGDRVADYAEQAEIPWKFHTLIWGSQYPNWIVNLSQAEQMAEIEEWYDAAKQRYPEIPMIDVVNEAYPNHAPPPFKEAMGGDGDSGYDWIVKAFNMARERWPKAILIYNDYNNIEYGDEVNWTVNMVNKLIEVGAPINSIGCQAHDAYQINTNLVKNNIDELASTGLPLFITEYDINTSNDSVQLSSIQDQFPVFWNHPSIVGITYWGYIVGQTWKNGTGLIQDNGTERPAMTWLKEYVSENLSPPNQFPRFLKEGSINSIRWESPAEFEENSVLKIFDLQGREITSFVGDRARGNAYINRLSSGPVILNDGRTSKIFYGIR